MTVPTVAFEVAMSVVAADTSVSSVSVPSSSCEVDAERLLDVQLHGVLKGLEPLSSALTW